MLWSELRQTLRFLVDLPFRFEGISDLDSSLPRISQLSVRMSLSFPSFVSGCIAESRFFYKNRDL
ncbi:hypothetical protein A0128_02745 [Leptospira tipperaryensis]|uniref:Uncharacterized protein n=1 Tax=Leptospira tipperaryensis TaxID=2564040 RepID=A0A1D7UTE0_9LEPT|nr:hypothetical protein A0128_02745 [Leptospira tipperaryensis]